MVAAAVIAGLVLAFFLARGLASQLFGISPIDPFTLTGVVAVISAEDVPDIDLLEYLGSWESVNGEYVDPMEFATEDARETTNQEKVSDEQ